MFLISLAVSIVLTVIFWSFGVAHRIWPAHPMLATTLVAAIACGLAAGLRSAVIRRAVKLLAKAIGWTDAGAPFALIGPGPGDDAPPMA